MDGLLERLAREVALVVLVTIALAGCATMATCVRTPIVVAAKEERTRMESRRGPPRVTGTGAVEEPVEIVPVVEYFVRSRDGGPWYRITRPEFEAVAPGQTLAVCR